MGPVNHKVENLVIIWLLLILVSCNTVQEDIPGSNGQSVATEDSSSEIQQGSRMGMMGGGSDMMGRHHAVVPEEYAGLSNPVVADEESLAKGGEIYSVNCAVCHGDGGMGDGPAAAGLEPAPAPIAHTSQMLGDDYLFWRISEGGAMEPFNSAMVAWKGTLAETARWNVINYVQALGGGQIQPGQNMGGVTFDPDAEATKHAQTMDQAIEQNLISQEEATVFTEVHKLVDDQMAQMREAGASEGMDELMDEILAALVANGEVIQDQADTFLSVHERLAEAGLMQ